MLAYIKKSDGIFRKRTSVKYAWIKTQADIWPIAVMCYVFNISESGYYHHNAHVCAQKSINDQALLTHIRAIYAEVKGEYGWPRIWRVLMAKGVSTSKERVRKLMQLNGIYARGKRKFVVTTDSKHHLPIAPNARTAQFQSYCP